MATAPNQALLDRLRALLGPKGYVDREDDIAPWLTDWRGRYVGRTTAMLSPVTVDEVAAVVSLAAEAGVALVPQGGNTSMVAGATPPADGSALLLSLRRFNQIRSVESGIAVADAGVILSDLHDAVAQAGMRFPLSLGAKGSATIGGLVSTNAGGTQVLRFGTMRSLVLGIEAVLPNGERYDGLAPLKKDNRGYDLRQLLVGAEGTLGVVTAASLKLVPAAVDRAVAWVGLADPHAALALLRLAEAWAGDAIESFEIVPDSSLQLVLAHVSGTRAPLATRHRWHVLIEAVGEDAAGQLEALLESALEHRLATDAIVAANEGQAAAFWRIRESIAEAERAAGPAVQHDLSVPVAAMPGFMLATAAAVEAAFPGVSAAAFGHLGDGNVHFHVRAAAGVDRDAWLAADAEAITRFVDDRVVAAGGSISAEHGIGQAKLVEFVRLEAPARLAALAAIKAALDPGGIMNPGKLIPLAPPLPRQ